ncbi:hypothetical protein GDO86_007676 [Hymenochirus boettgeri]|uniref:eEF1A lysine and N-terminal methyltransferase n=1 Tax=Hymenochirus boettgeri TaxID=247094 RepID=A0A8T2IYF6_9PIPI|nr:hypothetical protein GDO86_007676 [Hymenochirus boettgeri]
MNLLPKSSKEFASPEYWEHFFRRRGDRAFEWYGGYLELCGLLHKYIKPKDKVLVVGCGNSELSEKLYDAGCQKITNIDVSEVVIRQMKDRNSSQRPHMIFQLMDATQTTFSDSSFQVVLDKGTLDAIMTDTEKGTLETAGKMMSEIGRVLQYGGRFLCISLAQAHVLEKLVGHFSQGGWMVRVHQVQQGNSSVNHTQFPMPVFVFVMTKIRQMPGFPQVLEIMPDEEGVKPANCASPKDLMEAVKERQQYALIKNRLNQNQSSEEVSLDLCNENSGKSRYTFYIVDSPTIRLSHSNHFAIFIIPHGRETEWLFGSERGRKQLAGSVGFRRLIVVALHRDQQYTDMKGIQSELSAKVLELAPPGLPDNHQVPFLSVGEDLGARIVQHQGKSQLSGDYVVEDVRGDDNINYRRLVFLSTQNIVQSEARLLPIRAHAGQKKRKDKKKQPPKLNDVGQPTMTMIDKSYLCCEHHKAMISGLSLLPDPGLLPERRISVLVIGLGGGSLPLFIHDYFPGSSVEVVEIDPSVLDVACNWFGFSQDDRMKVYIADGLVHINTLSDKGGVCYDVVIFDVDSKDPSVGMSCPPPAFVEKLFLLNVLRILNTNGIFILNLVCRDLALRSNVLKVLHEIFPLIYAQKIEEEVNEILFCLNSDRNLNTTDIAENAKKLEKQLRNPGLPWDDTYSLADMLKSVKIV